MCNFGSESKTIKLPKCQDKPDDPKAGNFCSLCGLKVNQPIEITMFRVRDCPALEVPRAEPRASFDGTRELLVPVFEYVPGSDPPKSKFPRL